MNRLLSKISVNFRGRSSEVLKFHDAGRLGSIEKEQSSTIFSLKIGEPRMRA